MEGKKNVGAGSRGWLLGEQLVPETSQWTK